MDTLGSPALVLLVTRGRLLPECERWNMGVWGPPLYIVCVGYSILVVIVSMVRVIALQTE